MKLSYNERNFERYSILARYHCQRFLWLINNIKQLKISSAKIIELGCFDAKTINFLLAIPIKIEKYIGLDADLEALNIGKEQWKDHPNVQLIFCEKPNDIPQKDVGIFDIGICMETLEHIPPDLVEPYLAQLSKIISGYFLLRYPLKGVYHFF